VGTGGFSGGSTRIGGWSTSWSFTASPRGDRP
jgi:hypothetical protein